MAEANSEVIVCQYYLENRCRFADKCRNLHPPKESQLEEIEQLELDIPQEIIVKENENLEKRETTSPKRRMRTARDVIHRISWDPSLNSQDFTVVYLDRFIGLVEVPLTEFYSKSSEESTGISEVVPQHRIQMICYQKAPVWEKRSRTDLVFGSTGFHGTIVDFIRDYHNNHDNN